MGLPFSGPQTRGLRTTDSDSLAFWGRKSETLVSSARAHPKGRVLPSHPASFWRLLPSRLCPVSHSLSLCVCLCSLLPMRTPGLGFRARPGPWDLALTHTECLVRVCFQIRSRSEALGRREFLRGHSPTRYGGTIPELVNETLPSYPPSCLRPNGLPFPPKPALRGGALLSRPGPISGMKARCQVAEGCTVLSSAKCPSPSPDGPLSEDPKLKGCCGEPRPSPCPQF